MTATATKPRAPSLVEQLRAHATDTAYVRDCLMQTAAVRLEQLARAAERVCWFDWSDNDADAVAAVEALRAELGPVITLMEPRP